MKFTINIEKRYACIIAGLLILSIGIFVAYALTPGVAPNPGHLISEVAPPADCEVGQVLQWDGSNWDCVDLPSSIEGTLSDPVLALGEIYPLSTKCTYKGVEYTIPFNKLNLYGTGPQADPGTLYLFYYGYVADCYDGCTHCNNGDGYGIVCSREYFGKNFLGNPLFGPCSCVEKSFT